MPASQFTYMNFVAGNVATAVAAETVVATTRAVSSPAAGAGFGILFRGFFTVGATTTAVVFRVRRDSLTGAVVLGPETSTYVAGNAVPVVFELVDFFTGESTGQIWVLTAAQTGGTVAGGMTDAFTAVTTPV